jgi:hypothetical protein
MSNFKLAQLKKPLLGVALMKTASAALAFENGKVEDGCGKSSLVISDLRLDEMPGKNATICIHPQKQEFKEKECLPENHFYGNQFLSNEFTVLISPFESSEVEIFFMVSEVIAAKNDKDHLLLLAYSQKLTPSPDIPTPKSLNKLQLDINTLEVLGLYDVPAIPLLDQPATRIGRANLLSYSNMRIKVDLDTETVATMMVKDRDTIHRSTIYLQAALLPRSDFDSGVFNNMILSEVDTIHFVKDEKCPKGTETYTSENVRYGIYKITPEEE